MPRRKRATPCGEPIETADEVVATIPITNTTRFRFHTSRGKLLAGETIELPIGEAERLGKVMRGRL